MCSFRLIICGSVLALMFFFIFGLSCVFRLLFGWWFGWVREGGGFVGGVGCVFGFRFSWRSLVICWGC